jgi:hypothetical protein
MLALALRKSIQIPESPVFFRPFFARVRDAQNLYRPGPHTQALAAVLPAGEVAPTEHCSHGVLPVTDLYFPASHAEHVSQYASGPVYPTGHCFFSIQIVFPVPQLPLW